MKMRVMAMLGAAILAVSAYGYDQPAVNLGFTSFLDGGPPAGPGWYYAQYVQFYTADTLPDLPFPGDPKLDAWIGISQLIYQSEKSCPITGAKIGLNLMVPYVDFDLDAAGTPLTAQDGMGDLVVGPFLQWDPMMGDKGPVFMHRVELQMILPTGEYDNQVAINPGSDVFSFNPYWAATWFAANRCTVSWRLHYLWNEKNTDPNLPGVDELRAGQAIHANFATDYAVLDHVRIGVNGYYFKQVEDSKVNGTSVDGKEQVLGLGPGVLWSFNQDNHLFLNAYFEMDAENRPEGDRFNLRYVHHF